MLGPGQDVAIEDPRGVAGDRFGPQSLGRNDQVAAPLRRSADDFGGEGRLHATELPVEGRDRGDGLELSPPERRVGRGSVTAGDIEHDLNEVRQGEFAGVLVLGHLLEELVEGGCLNDPIQGDSCHNAGRSPFDEGVEDGRKDHLSLLGRRVVS
jgi:hypothetical protein